MLEYSYSYIKSTNFLGLYHLLYWTTPSIVFLKSRIGIFLISRCTTDNSNFYTTPKEFTSSIPRRLTQSKDYFGNRTRTYLEILLCLEFFNTENSKLYAVFFSVTIELPFSLEALNMLLGIHDVRAPFSWKYSWLEQLACTETINFSISAPYTGYIALRN